MRAPIIITILLYVGMRIARRLISSRLSSVLMRRRFFLVPGLETTRPAEAAKRYCEALASLGLDIADKKCMIFGYGGILDTAAELLLRGARFVILYDKYAQAVWPSEMDAFSFNASRIFIVSEEELPNVCPEVIVSSSVFEHVDDVAGCVEQLARLTPPSGIHLHFIDLRDHFFAYPFHMLCFSPGVWRRALNPPTNLNRLRTADFVRIFGTHFANVRCKILKRDIEAFNSIKHHIRPEFLTGNDADDSATQILIIASQKPLYEGAV